MATVNGPNCFFPESGQYCWHLILLFSLRLVSMTIMGGLSCHMRRQKSTRVRGSGPVWGGRENITLNCTLINLLQNNCHTHNYIAGIDSQVCWVDHSLTEEAGCSSAISMQLAPLIELSNIVVHGRIISVHNYWAAPRLSYLLWVTTATWIR